MNIPCLGCLVTLDLVGGWKEEVGEALREKKKSKTNKKKYKLRISRTLCGWNSAFNFQVYFLALTEKGKGKNVKEKSKMLHNRQEEEINACKTH